MPKTIRARVIEAAPVKTALKAARQAQDAHLARLRELEDLLNPDLKKRRLEAAMRELTTPQEIEVCRKAIAELGSEAAAIAAHRAAALAAESFKVFMSTLPGLVEAGEAALQDVGSEVEVAEHALFSQFAVDRAPTPLTAEVKRLQGGLAHMRNSLSEAQTARNIELRPQAMQHFIAFFE